MSQTLNYRRAPAPLCVASLEGLLMEEKANLYLQIGMGHRLKQHEIITVK